MRVSIMIEGFYSFVMKVSSDPLTIFVVYLLAIPMWFYMIYGFMVLHLSVKPFKKEAILYLIGKKELHKRIPAQLFNELGGYRPKLTKEGAFIDISVSLLLIIIIFIGILMNLDHHIKLKDYNKIFLSAVAFSPYILTIFVAVYIGSKLRKLVHEVEQNSLNDEKETLS
jgi:hypothetical protein